MANAFVKHPGRRQLWLGLDAGNLETWASEYFSDLCHSGLSVYRMFLSRPGVATGLWASGWWEGVGLGAYAQTPGDAIT